MRMCCKFTIEPDRKNLENRLTFGKVMGKSLVSCFLTRSVYVVNNGANVHCVVCYRIETTPLLVIGKS